MSKAEKEYKRKYTMYIIDFSEWVTDFSLGYQMQESRCFLTGQWDFDKQKIVDPYKLNVEEVLWCIADCVLTYNSYRFKVYPEKEFLQEYEEFRKNDKERFEDIVRWNEDLDFDNILNIPKKEKFLDFVKINRNTFIDFHDDNKKNRLYTYYGLTSDGLLDWVSLSKLNDNCQLKFIYGNSYDFERRNRYFAASTPIISFKKVGDEYIFETIRSIIKTKTIIEPEYTNTISELENYLKSDELSEFMKAWEREEMLYANV